VPHVLQDFDLFVRHGLEAIANVSIDDATWAQSSLPVSRGGLGIRRASDISIRAFIASIAFTKDLVSPITGSAALISDLDGEVCMAEWLTLSDSTQPSNHKSSKGLGSPDPGQALLSGHGKLNQSIGQGEITGGIHKRIRSLVQRFAMSITWPRP
jgi:hypothetical protein